MHHFGNASAFLSLASLSSLKGKCWRMDVEADVGVNIYCATQLAATYFSVFYIFSVPAWQAVRRRKGDAWHRDNLKLPWHKDN
jgi:hypothetical protein